MKKILLLFTLILTVLVGNIFAQTAIFTPSMSITGYGDVYSGSGDGEAVDKIIDGNSATKFLDFNKADGMGFTVNLGGLSRTATSMDVTTAGDEPGRDAKTYEVFGSNDGTNFTSIATGSITCVSTRNNTTNHTFSNSTAYTHYRVNFATQCGSNSEMQVAEVQLYYIASPCSTPTNQPTSLTLSNVTHNSVDGSFTAATSSPDKYLVVRSTSSSLSSNPVDETTYSTSDPLGGGTVVQASSSTSFSATGLSSETTYYFFVFSYNSECCSGPKYLSTSPLSGNETTVAAPSVYSDGDISTSLNSSPTVDDACNGPSTVFSTIVPSGGPWEVTSIDIEYDMTATGGAYISEQRSLIYCQNTTTSENGGTWYSGTGSGGTQSYNRTGVTIANGTYSSGTSLDFEMWADRTWGGSGCGTSYNYVANETWKITVNYTVVPPCSTPTDQPTSLILSNVLHNSIDGSFTDATSSPDKYLVVRSTSSTLSSNPVDETTYSTSDPLGGGVVVQASSSTTFSATGLNSETTYYFFIFSYNSDCSSGPKYLTTSPLTGNETTVVTPTTCEHTINLTDQASDGWDGGAVTVKVNGTAVLTDITLASGGGPEPRTFQADAGDDINVTRTIEGAYPGEMEIEVLDGESNTIITIREPQDGVGLTVSNGTCPTTCPSPTTLAASNITASTADLSWVIGDSETLWDIELGANGFSATETPTQSGVTKPYTYTGLTSATSYDYYVRADCGGSDYSDWVGPFNFTTSSVAMTYVTNSLTESQASTESVEAGSTNNEILQISIETEGTLSALVATDFIFNITGDDGTTNKNDLTNAKLYYTETTNTFSTGSPVGATITSFNTDFTISAEQTLSTGVNYFWLTYDIESGATVNNKVDAVCSSVKIDGTTETTSGTPTGSRSIVEPPVQIGSDTPSNKYFVPPMYPSNDYTYSQSIFDASEINKTGTISKIEWQYTGQSISDNIVVYLGYTTKITFSSDNDYEAVGGLTQVYSGSINATTGWVTIILDTPFDYDHTVNNLLVAVDENSSTSYTANDYFYQTSCSGNKSLTASGGTNINPSSPTTGARQVYRPNSRFYISTTPILDMEYTTNACVQDETDKVANSDANQEVVGLQITTTNYNNPLTFDEIVVNMLSGSGTSDITDVSNIDVYYTTSSTYDEASPGTFFGSGTPSTSDITISKDGGFTTNLAEGSGNYFWIVYDIASSVTMDNTIDVKIVEFTLSDATNPTINCSPTGTRTIDYCDSYSNTTNNSLIQRVVLDGYSTNDLDNNSGQACTAYTDYTTVTAPQVYEDGTYTVSITQGTCGGDVSRNCNAWIDYNEDGDFDDANEQLNGSSSSSSVADYVHNFEFTVPSGTTTGNKRMRIIISENGNPSCGVCGEFVANGETEDYTVNIITPVNMTYVSNTITQTETSDVMFGQTDKEILGMEIVTQDLANALSLTQLKMTIGVSDDNTDINDIDNVKVYYTSSSSSFATGTLVGTFSASATEFILDITDQVLIVGSNYFWIAYDIASDATGENYLDGVITELTIGTTKTPSNDASVGTNKRQIINNILHPTGSNESYTLCDGKYYDDGGSAGDYSNNGGSSVTFYPATASTKMVLNFTSFETYDGWDKIKIYDGNSTAETLLEIALGDMIPEDGVRLAGQFVSTAADGSLTVWFESNDNTVDPGWVADIQCGVNMTYNNTTTTTQNNTDNVDKGDTDMLIISIPIVMDNNMNNPSVQSFDITMAIGSGADDINDVDDINIYCTGISSTFATTDLFGTASSATGTINITGSQELYIGTTYFWVTYDITTDATYENYVDATCELINLSGGAKAGHVPVIPAPAGARKIREICDHKLELWGDNGQWTGVTLDLIVNGTTLLSGLSPTTSYEEFIFSASEDDTITTTYTGAAPSTYYSITDQYDEIMYHTGNENTIPSSIVVGDNIRGSCGTYSDFRPNRSAYKQNDSDSCYVLTENIKGQGGSIFSNYRVNYAEDFTIEASMYFGDKDATGADGMTLIFMEAGDGTTDPTNYGCATDNVSSGSSMGAEFIGQDFGRLPESMAVEFDTYVNASRHDPSSDHIALFRSSNYLDHDVTDDIFDEQTISDIENSTWYDMKYVWTAADSTIKVYFDDMGTPKIDYSMDVVNRIFKGDSIVFWGFTGSTGANYNHQEVCISGVTNSTKMADEYIVVEDTAVAEAPPGGKSYSWSPVTDVSDPSARNPIITPTVTTTYTVAIEDACGNMIYDNVVMTVGDAPLPIELASFTAECSKVKNVIVRWITISETNNDFFTLYRSKDGKEFEKITKIIGAGTISNMMNYEYVDDVNEIYYYRLKQTDFDGQYSYSDIIMVNCQTMLDDIKIHPNPSTGEYNITFSHPKNEIIDMRLTDIYGNVILEEKIPVGTKTYKITIDDKVESGIYYIIFKSKVNTKTKKIVKL